MERPAIPTPPVLPARPRGMEVTLSPQRLIERVQAQAARIALLESVQDELVAMVAEKDEAIAQLRQQVADLTPAAPADDPTPVDLVNGHAASEVAATG